MRHVTLNDDENDAVQGISDNEKKPETATTSQVDAALMQLDKQLENTAQEATILQERLESLWKAKEVEFLKQKWSETIAFWVKAQKEAEATREELVEDK